MQRITTNINGGNIRYESLHGRDYLVAPMTMLVEGIHNGSNGPLYYPRDELSKAPATWNLTPVVVYHPAGGTATTPAELTTRQVGMVMNTAWDGRRLRAEAWLVPERLEAVDAGILEALEAGQTMEVSTGLFTDNVPSPGVWNGKQYDYVARNHRPDHLAILPTGVGACSVADGCGLLQLNKENEMQNNETPLVAPTMNFGKPCGCKATNNDGGDSRPVVAPPCWPVPTHQPTANNATGGGQGGDVGEPLVMPPSI